MYLGALFTSLKTCICYLKKKPRGQIYFKHIVLYTCLRASHCSSVYQRQDHTVCVYVLTVNTVSQSTVRNYTIFGVQGQLNVLKWASSQMDWVEWSPRHLRSPPPPCLVDAVSATSNFIDKKVFQPTLKENLQYEWPCERALVISTY